MGHLPQCLPSSCRKVRWPPRPTQTRLPLARLVHAQRLGDRFATSRSGASASQFRRGVGSYSQKVRSRNVGRDERNERTAAQRHRLCRELTQSLVAPNVCRVDIVERTMLEPIPTFGKMLDQLKAAGIETRNARGFWGGITASNHMVVTAWTDRKDADGRFPIKKPKRNHGRLKLAWELGNIHVGAEVSLILVRPRGAVPSTTPGRPVGEAALMEGKWRVVEMTGSETALIERIPVS